MAWDKCDDCKGTGKTLTESINISRPYYSKKENGLVYDITGKGDWKETLCHCVGEEE